MSFREVLQRGVDEINRAASTDRALKNALKEYDGRRVVLNIVGDMTYVATISSEQVALTTGAVADAEDMYIEMGHEIAQKLISQEMNPLQLSSMVLSRKVRIRNIGEREINLVRTLYRGF
jgi:hypothetical protein